MDSATPAKIGMASPCLGTSSATDPSPPQCAHCRTASGVQHSFGPGSILQSIHIALVQPDLRAVPELERIRHETETRPVRRARHGPAVVLLLELGVAPLELLAAGHRRGLQRGPRTQLAAARSGG